MFLDFKRAISIIFFILTFLPNHSSASNSVCAEIFGELGSVIPGSGIRLSASSTQALKDLGMALSFERSSFTQDWMIRISDPRLDRGNDIHVGSPRNLQVSIQKQPIYRRGIAIITLSTDYWTKIILIKRGSFRLSQNYQILVTGNGPMILQRHTYPYEFEIIRER